MTVILDGVNLKLLDILRIAQDRVPCEIPSSVMMKVTHSRRLFEDIASQNIPIYGVTTGYGEMVYMLVEADKESELQSNLVRSHCAGVGPHFSVEEARAMLAARVNALARGYSAVRPELIKRMLLYLNADIIPIIPEIGSLGASGDLAPLSHIAITLMGEGYVFHHGRKTPTKEVLQERGITPLQLKFKEGLALINGTSAMTGLGALVVYKGLEQVRQAEIVSALVLQTQRASSSPFLAEGHELARPHEGQMNCAYNLRLLTQDSQLMKPHEDLRAEALHQKSETTQVHRTNVYLQKAYTLRCIPQILGAVRDTLSHAENTLEIELNSSNDNPLFFEGQEIFHGGNFHGQPVAFVLDFATVALTQLGVVSERRTNRLLNRHLSNGLPEFLVKSTPGLNSGFAGTQYTATALVAENRTIGPASIQSIPSNGDNQDVVSMGLIAARNARRVLTNNNYILAVEYLSAAQAVDIAQCYDRLSKAGKITYKTVRSLAATLDQDRDMSEDIEAVARALSRGEFLKVVEEAEIRLM
ncbi:MAG: tyrosine 2,3-aminomutase [Ktedonobacteraceae bacterium]|nr:tyrosine 2,3-aminomutase [Ktedonobacteraceae bacterium]